VRRKLYFTYVLILIFISLGFQCANAAELNWVWYYSSDYVSEYYGPESIKIVMDYNGNIGRIEVWTKTTYSQEGANDTINSYELNNVANIDQLSYSLAKIYIKPNSRQIYWQNEIFYNAQGNVLWSKEKSEYVSKWEEVCPDSSEERSFTFILDQVFHNGQTIAFDMWKADNKRWQGLYQITKNDGTVHLAWFDKLSLTVKDNIITYWYYVEEKQDDNIIDKYYVKNELDIQENKIRNIGIRLEDKKGNWNYHNTNKTWASIIPGSIGDQQVTILKKYIENNKTEDFNNIPTSKKTEIASDNFTFEYKRSKNLTI
jgi:hypothetical protein